MKQSVNLKRVSIFRRLCAMLLDFIIFISLFFITVSFVLTPIINSTTDYPTVLNNYNTRLTDTHLFSYYTENGTLSYQSKNYEVELKYFYDNVSSKNLTDSDELKSKYTSTSFLELYRVKSDVYVDSDGNKLENPYFIYDASTNTYSHVTDTDGTMEANISSYFSTCLRTVADDFLSHDTTILQYSTKLNSYIRLIYIISVIPSALITFLLFPMIFKDGTTIGKKVLQMRVVDAKTGANASKFKLFIRFVFFALLCIAFGVFTFGISIIIQIGVMVFSPKRQTVHDMIAGTLVVCSPVAEMRNTNDADDIVITYDDGKESNENNNENNEMFTQYSDTQYNDDKGTSNIDNKESIDENNKD